jgi:pimeloyl-ACP methyl ester carboxylesterase
MMEDRVRWINFAIPGFDGSDERRGAYKGSFEDIKTLLISLFLKLGVKRVVVCGSSFGTSIGNKMAKQCP